MANLDAILLRHQTEQISYLICHSVGEYRYLSAPLRHPELAGTSQDPRKKASSKKGISDDEPLGQKPSESPRDRTERYAR